MAADKMCRGLYMRRSHQERAGSGVGLSLSTAAIWYLDVLERPALIVALTGSTALCSYDLGMFKQEGTFRFNNEAVKASLLGMLVWISILI